MSVSTLAALVGTDKATISRLERGQAGISVERLQRIASALGADPAVLLSSVSPPTRAA